jgi:hypothetical protein
MSSTSPEETEEGGGNVINNPSVVVEQASSVSSASSSPAYLSSLPLFNHRAIKTGIQLTWPPPPLPQSPSSSATATPVTPTLPPLPTTSSEPQCQHLHPPHLPAHNGNSPKCFGHQRIFQWPIPALKLANKSPKPAAPHPLQRNNSTTQPSPSAGTEATSKPSWRPSKPSNLEDAQDWYWTEEFPLAAGLEPGTGNMSAWFHAAISRWEAERRLTNQPTGAFLARLTERLWGYAISVRNPSGSVSHFLVDAGEKRSHKKYTLLGSTDPPHKSLRKSIGFNQMPSFLKGDSIFLFFFYLGELIQYYGKHALTPDGSEKLLFPCPQESSVAFPVPINGSSSSRLIKST